MKKFLALVLSLCLVLSLAACGGKPADDDTAEGYPCDLMIKSSVKPHRAFFI